jgi:hypothetical protein
MQRWFAILFAAVVAVSLFGTRWECVWEYVIGAPSPLWMRVVSSLQWLDQKALELGFFPLGLAVGLVGLVLTYELPRVWSHFRRFDRHRKEFEAAFQRLDQQTARQQFAWTLESAYRTHKCTSDKRAFRNLIDNVRFPFCFPPERGIQLSDYAH